MTGVAEAFAAAPSPEADLASERGRLGGRVGYNFGTGTLYTQNRYNDRLRRHLLEEAEAEPEAAAAPGPEYDLAADRSSIAMDPATLSDVTLRYGTSLPEIQAGLGRRRFLEAEAEAEPEAAAAPGPEYDLAADRSSIAMDPATLSDVTLRYGTYLPEIQ